MDGKFQTSFIPKKPIIDNDRIKGPGMSLFMVVSIFVFVVSGALAGLVFGGQKYLSSQIEKDKEELVKAQELFDVKTIEALVLLDKRINFAKEILSKHIIVSPIFDYLESNTLKNVRFKSMDLKFSNNNAIELEMKGEAKNFSAVALQSDLFSSNKDFKEALVSDIDSTLEGVVVFNFKSKIEPSFLLYKKDKATKQ